jgi:RNA polymerase sigma factor (sigma-70 family)
MSNFLVTDRELKSGPPPDSVIRLVQQVVAGNREAEAHFYEVFQPLVLKWIQKLAGKVIAPVPLSTLTKDDAWQRALTRLIYGDESSQAPGDKNSPLRKWLEFEGPRRMSLYTYVRRNVEFFFKDFASAYALMRTRELRGLESVIGGYKDSSFERRVQLTRCINECLELLSPQARTIIVSVYYEGYTQADTARMLGMNEPTFSRHCRKAEEQFSALVKQNCPQEVLPSLLRR